MRDYGKYFNVGYMLGKDKVRSRMETGITYAEFSYMILQALDFMYLFEHNNCTLQVAGSDQWGNITSGIELIRRKLGKEAYGMVMPLVTDSNGVKFGKTEGNALWLDKNKTSSYQLYQYLINLEDSMIISYLKMLTFLSKEEIEELEKKNKEHPELREAHKALAKEIINDLHGKGSYEKAEAMSSALFTGKFTNLGKEEIEELFKDYDKVDVNEGTNILDLLINMGAASSKREAREFVLGNAVSINGEKVTDIEYLISSKDFLDNVYLILRRGKKNYYIGKRG